MVPETLSSFTQTVLQCQNNFMKSARSSSPESADHSNGRVLLSMNTLMEGAVTLQAADRSTGSPEAACPGVDFRISSEMP